MRMKTDRLPVSLTQDTQKLSQLQEVTRSLVAGRKRKQDLLREHDDILAAALTPEQRQRVFDEIPEACKKIDSLEKELKERALGIVNDDLGLGGGSWSALGIKLTVPKVTLEYDIPPEHLEAIEAVETLAAVEVDGRNLLQERIYADMDVFAEALRRGIIWDGEGTRPAHAIYDLSDLIASGIVVANSRNRSVRITSASK